MDLCSFLHTILIALYGLRLCAFLLWRERLSSYQEYSRSRLRSVEDTLPSIPLPMSLGLAMVYLSLFLPAYHNIQFHTPIAHAMSPMLEWKITLSWVGLALAAMALAVEALADYQHQMFFEGQKKSGKRPRQEQQLKPLLWRLFENTNYISDGAFWLMSWLAGVRGYRSVLEGALSFLGAFILVFVVRTEAKRRSSRHSSIIQVQTWAYFWIIDGFSSVAHHEHAHDRASKHLHGFITTGMVLTGVSWRLITVAAVYMYGPAPLVHWM